MQAVEHLTNLLHGTLAEMGLDIPEKGTVEPPKKKEFGDLAANHALMCAKQAKKNPREVAEAIKTAILEKDADIQSVEIAGPGFLNFTFRPSFWQKTIAEVLKRGNDYGRVDHGKGRKVQVEYVSANPTGPLHIGHGRGAAVGDSLARILRFTGYDAETEYYVNDAGRQMLLLGTAVWVRLQQSQGKDIDLPEECYKGDYIKDIAAEVLELYPEIAEADEETAVNICKDHATKTILDGIKQDLADFRVEHQVWFSESSLVESGAVQKTFERLQKVGLAYEQDGALWFKTTQFGDDKDRVLRKSNGYLTYFASDIAYHDDKYNRGFDLVVDIWGADHHGYVPRMASAVQALGKTPDQFKVILVQLVNLLQGGEQISMSTRAGKFETLADVVKEVGTDAARFIFLSRKSDSKLDFDLELVKQVSMDNPVYYVQYAHARIMSVQRKAKERDLALDFDLGDTERIHTLAAALDTPEDMDLLKTLARLPEILVAAADTLSPHSLSYYLTELAGTLHRYYTVHQILAAPDEKTIQARLLLITATAQVLRNGLALLGVEAPERM